MSNGWPVDLNTRISQDFGGNPASYQPDGHTGMDFALPIGSPVYAVADGTILHASWSSELGWPNPYYINPDFTPNDGIDQSAGIVVVIDHGSFVSISAHLDSEGLNNGDKVKRGQIIGRSGNTGFSSGPHLHFEILPDKWNVHGKYYGRVNPLNYISKTVAAPSATSDQRVTGAAVNYRKAPNTGAEIIQKFEADTILDFKGYVTNGEKVQGNSVWFVGKYTNGYAWSGGFINSSVNGLPNLTPAAPPAPKPAPAPSVASDQRVTGAAVNYRKAPNTGAEIIQKFDADTILDFKGYVTNGEKVQDNSVWFVGKYTNGYAWSGGFVNSSVNGLQNLTPAPVPVTPKPIPVPSVPVVTPPVYVPPAVPAFKGDLPCITEFIEAGEGNWKQGNFPVKPTTAVVHDFGSHGRDTYKSSVAHFKNGNRENPSSAHVLISGKHITQMVRFKDRAYGSGPDGNNFIQVELDPEVFYGTPLGEETKASARKFFQELFDYYGYKLELIEHNSLMNTLCGDEIDLSWFADIDVTKKPTPAPVTPKPIPVKTSLEDLAKSIENIAQQIRNL